MVIGEFRGVLGGRGGWVFVVVWVFIFCGIDRFY